MLRQLRQGNWKLVTLNDRSSKEWEWYDRSLDRSETANVIDEHPDLARARMAKWRAWVAEVNVLPFPEDRGEATLNRPPQANRP